MKRGFDTVFYTVCILLGMMAGCCGHGTQGLLTKAKPETCMTVDPIRKIITLHNSKDVAVSLEEFSGKTKDGGEWKVAGLQITDDASTVRHADAVQLQVTTDLLKTFVDALFSGLAKNNPIAGASVALDTPIGSGSLQTGGGATASPGLDEAALRRIIREEIGQTKSAEGP